MLQSIRASINNFRYRLAHIEALPQLTILGLIIGVAASAVIIAFRLAIELPLAAILSEGGESFESLPLIWRFALPFIGAVIIGLIFQCLDKKHLSVSASHVLDRLHRFQGRMPLSNMLVQFFAGIACLLTGQSVGREGPAVHLGAGSASLLGQWLKLPNNSLRPMIGCGVAAAISASFNTPLAGVIFAMEVILMEYSIAGFIPVILASVTGAVASRMFFGHGLAFDAAAVQVINLWELPYVAFAGLVIAVSSAIFIHLQIICQPLHKYPVAIRLAVAGFITGLAALYVPEIMGVGYDTISDALHDELVLTLLMLIIACKLSVTAISLGLGMPGGVIGPTLFLGACIGAALGICGQAIFPESSSSPAFYALLGMAAMMAAVINAPLAALVAVLELTGNPSILFPSMLMIVVACLCTRQVFGCDSIFQSLLRAQGKPIETGADQQLLSRAGVTSIMSTQFVLSLQTLSHPQAKQLLSSEPRWLLIDDLNCPPTLLRAVDVAKYLDDAIDISGEDSIDLLEIPGQRWELAPIHNLANLFEARTVMNDNRVDALSIMATESSNSPFRSRICGIITRGALENFYQKPVA